MIFWRIVTEWHQWLHSIHCLHLPNLTCAKYEFIFCVAFCYFEPPDAFVISASMHRHWTHPWLCLHFNYHYITCALTYKCSIDIHVLQSYSARNCLICKPFKFWSRFFVSQWWPGDGAKLFVSCFQALKISSAYTVSVVLLHKLHFYEFYLIISLVIYSYLLINLFLSSISNS